MASWESRCRHSGLGHFCDAAAHFDWAAAGTRAGTCRHQAARTIVQRPAKMCNHAGLGTRHVRSGCSSPHRGRPFCSACVAEKMLPTTRTALLLFIRLAAWAVLRGATQPAAKAVCQLAPASDMCIPAAHGWQHQLEDRTWGMRIQALTAACVRALARPPSRALARQLWRGRCGGYGTCHVGQRRPPARRSRPHHPWQCGCGCAGGPQ